MAQKSINDNDWPNNEKKKMQEITGKLRSNSQSDKIKYIAGSFARTLILGNI